MKLRRYAIAEFAERIPQVAKWTTSPEEGVSVEIFDLLNTDEVPMTQGDWPSPQLVVQRDHDSRTLAILCATVSTTVRRVSPIEIEFDDESRLRAEDALRFMGASLAILSQVPCQLWSPTPYLALEGQSAEDLRILEDVIRITLPPWKAFYPFACSGLAAPLDTAHPSLRDRRDGVLLLGAAVSAGHGVGKVHELFRLFEHAFAKPPRLLIRPLAEFLESNPSDLGYTVDEVENWVSNVRDPATHADLDRQNAFALDHHVQAHLMRIEQAAFDVLFNKKTWHSPNGAREDRNPLRCAASADSGMRMTDGARVGTVSAWDQYEAFQLRGRLDLPAPADMPRWGYRFAHWHFTEDEHEQLRRYQR
jgi:hypothetical protein